LQKFDLNSYYFRRQPKKLHSFVDPTDKAADKLFRLQSRNNLGNGVMPGDAILEISIFS